ncbi:MAG: hypothetical protein SFX18_02880 [Pirellulales bacterium]|nr:hypothetical protein [Pirellulales bacterium]
MSQHSWIFLIRPSQVAVWSVGVMCFLLACGFAPSRADAHGVQIVLGNSGGQITTDQSYYADRELRIFSFTDRPDFVLTAIPSAAELQLQILEKLVYWSPTLGLNDTTNATLSVLSAENNFQFSVASQSFISNPNPFVIRDFDNPIQDHLLNFILSNGAPLGAYGVKVRLLTTDFSLQPSEPFWIIHNRGLSNNFSIGGNSPGNLQPLNDGSQFGAAVAAITAIPEPEAWTALFAVVVAGMARVVFRHAAKLQTAAV